VSANQLGQGLAKMLKGGVIMDVVNPDQAKLAEQAGAVAVMALEKIPADIRAQGGVARMSQVELIEQIKQAVNIPVMAKCRIGHFVEAQILEELGVDYIDESEVLTPADQANHIVKHNFKIPFVCGAKDLGQALRRIAEGACMIRTKGEAGTGNIVQAVKHLRVIQQEVNDLCQLSESDIPAFCRQHHLPTKVAIEVRKLKRLPVVTFAAGGVATPADAALMMQLGSDGVFVGSGIFKSDCPELFAKSIVRSVSHFEDPKHLVQAHRGLGEAMDGFIVLQDKFADRGS
jgi:pyridoxal 5'-phosphate synthase pdxS subunit